MVQLVSQLLCPLAKGKRTKLLTKCLPFKWDYIPLSLIELAFMYQLSCPSPLLPQYHLIYKFLSWEKTSITIVLSLPLVPSLPSPSIIYLFFQNYNWPTKNIWEICVNKNSRGGWLGLGMGKSQDQVGIQCILFQIYPSCDSVKRGEGLTKAWTCNGTFVLEFEHFLKTGGRVGGQPKSNKTFLN